MKHKAGLNSPKLKIANIVVKCTLVLQRGDDESDNLFIEALYIGAVAKQKRDSDANNFILFTLVK